MVRVHAHERMVTHGYSTKNTARRGENSNVTSATTLEAVFWENNTTHFQTPRFHHDLILYVPAVHSERARFVLFRFVNLYFM